MRKNRNFKRKEAQKKTNQNEVVQSNLHAIDQLQTFYIKNWETQEYAEQQRANPQVSVQLQNKMVKQQLSESQSKKPLYSSSLPRLKPLAFSHERLKLIWKPKQSTSQKLLPQLKQQTQNRSIKFSSKKQKTLFSSRMNLQPLNSFLCIKKINDQSLTQRQNEIQIQKQFIYPRTRTETQSKLEFKFKEYKIDTKHNEIAHILKKHKNNYKSQVVHRSTNEKSKLSFQHKLIPIPSQIASQNRLIFESLKYYLNTQRNLH